MSEARFWDDEQVFSVDRDVHQAAIVRKQLDGLLVENDEGWSSQLKFIFENGIISINFDS